MKYLILVCIHSILPALYCGWAEETLEKMTVEEKVGQLFVIPVCPMQGEGEAHLEDLKHFLKTYPIGGPILKRAYPVEQVCFLNALQRASKSKAKNCLYPGWEGGAHSLFLLFARNIECDPFPIWNGIFSRGV